MTFRLDSWYKQYCHRDNVAQQDMVDVWVVTMAVSMVLGKAEMTETRDNMLEQKVEVSDIKLDQ
jgi:hypothetical protein